MKKDDHEASEAMDAIIDEIPDLKQDEQEKGETAGHSTQDNKLEGRSVFEELLRIEFDRERSVEEIMKG